MSGGGSKAPKSTTTTTSTIPKFAEPYAMEMLGRTQAMINQGPQTYQGQRTAGFNPMQEQAFRGIGGMQVNPGLQQSMGMAGIAGLGGLQNNRWTDPGVSQSYMSPYMDNVVKSQQEDAVRQHGIASNKLGASAATSGAFGGSRHAIENSEANRALGYQLGDIRAKGQQAAYDQGFDAFNSDEGRRLQGLGLTGQSAATMAGISGDQYNQQMGIYGAQQDVGGKMQGLEQQVLNTDYQDFVDRLNLPYEQMGFFSDLLHGLPTNNSTSVYGSPNTAAQTVGTLGGLASLYMGNSTSTTGKT